MALDARPDLKLKVEARLQQLFDRSMELTWSQNGLSPKITSTLDGTAYSANHEASGILQLVALLAAIHNDEIGALIIDEPEISLHPQHQAFLLDEIERVAGDPRKDRNKKLVVIATHAPALIRLRKASDLPNIAFFNAIWHPPAQVSADEDLLKSTKMKALLARLSATHRMAIFAERLLFVEGPSDETIVTQLTQRLDWPLLARNAIILPVTGKGEFPEVAKLFSLMGKKIGVLADLDAFVDDNKLVNFFSSQPGASAAAAKSGAESIVALDGNLRNALTDFMAKYGEAVDRGASKYPDWSAESTPEVKRKRVTVARILTNPSSFDGTAAEVASALCIRYAALLAMLKEVGCFFLRAGAVENYYLSPSDINQKPSAAADESESFISEEVGALEKRYDDVLDAVRFIAPAKGVDDNLLIRPKLGAAITAVFMSMKKSTSSAELTAMARGVIGSSAEVFSFENVSKDDQFKLRIGISSPLFQRDNFPIEVSRGQNINDVLPLLLPIQS